MSNLENRHTQHTDLLRITIFILIHPYIRAVRDMMAPVGKWTFHIFTSILSTSVHISYTFISTSCREAEFRYIMKGKRNGPTVTVVKIFT